MSPQTVTLTGYLGRDREIHETRPKTRTVMRYNDLAGRKVPTEITPRAREYAVFSLATTERVNGQPVTRWHRLLAWDVDRRPNFQYRLGYKGDLVQVTARVENFTFDAPDGTSRTITTHVLTSWKTLRKKITFQPFD